MNGDPIKLTLPMDAAGQQCGGPGIVGGQKYKEHPYIYFLAPSATSLWRTVCLKKCPTDITATNSMVTLECIPNASSDNSCVTTKTLAEALLAS